MSDTVGYVIFGLSVLFFIIIGYIRLFVVGKDRGFRLEGDPPDFGDPVAARTQWTRAKASGEDNRTRKIKPAVEGRLEFRIALGGMVFCGVFLLLGIGVVIGGILLAVSRFAISSVPVLFLCFFGSIFVVIGVCLFYSKNKPIVFDKHSGYFWKGYSEPQQALTPEMSKDFVRLKDIHAIQLLSKECSTHSNNSSGGKTYFCFEINLVLKDSSRRNVVDPGDLDVDRTRQDPGGISGGSSMGRDLSRNNGRVAARTWNPGRSAAYPVGLTSIFQRAVRTQPRRTIELFTT